MIELNRPRGREGGVRHDALRRPETMKICPRNTRKARKGRHFSQVLLSRVIRVFRGQIFQGALLKSSDRPSARILKGLWAKLNLVDRMTLGYLVYSVLLVSVCRDSVKHWEILLPVNFGLIGAVIGLATARARQIRVLSAVSHWYPAFLFLFFFEEIGFIVHAIFPQWFDHILIKADYALFGFHPTVWIEQFSNYWLTEYMQLVYTSYFLLTIGMGSYLWMRGRRNEFSIFMVSTCAAYYLCYIIFVLFPIESPHHTLSRLQQVELTGGPFTAFIDLIEKHGRVHGGAFPSAHVAGSVVVMITSWRFTKRAGYWLTPVVLSICVATIYGRYHYVMDVFAGALMAMIGCWIGASGWRMADGGWRIEKSGMGKTNPPSAIRHPPST